MDFCPDLPDSFDDWAEKQMKEQQRCEWQETGFLKVPVTSAEFKNYCKPGDVPGFCGVEWREKMRK